VSNLVVKSKFYDYSVEFTSINSIINLYNQPNVITIIDQNVYNKYPYFKNAITIECIEQNKNINYCIDIFDKFLDKNIKINNIILAIGGGILQDIVGFCASTYCRGIDYVLCPTTLLAQTDSCIGGKTSLNFKNKKNIIGTFYPPKNILISTEFLNTITNLDKISGFGEIYKFAILQNNIDKFNIDTNIEKLIYNSLSYKSSILEIDEFDKQERKFLNFGHTFGHAIESVSSYNIPHGIAVIIGCMIACNISLSLNFNISNFDQIMTIGKNLLDSSGIQISRSLFNFDELIKVMKSDKKNTGSGINMILLNNGPILYKIDDLLFLENILDRTLCEYQII
jgi:3-dehydroquinate synthase